MKVSGKETEANLRMKAKDLGSREVAQEAIIDSKAYQEHPHQRRKVVGRWTNLTYQGTSTLKLVAGLPNRDLEDGEMTHTPLDHQEEIQG